MTWVKLEGGSPEVECHPPGTIKWCYAAHRVIGSPVAVEVFHDAEANRLGVRRVGRNTPHCLGVVRDNGLYRIMATDHLQNAGIVFAEKHVTAMHEPDETGVCWFDLP